MRLIDISEYEWKGAEIQWVERNDYSISLRRISPNKIPTVDAVPVVHGQWEYIPGDGKFRAILICSKCKKCVGEYDRFDYCPHCGAKMDGGDADV